jgi:hypothetical protein
MALFHKRGEVGYQFLTMTCPKKLIHMLSYSGGSKGGSEMSRKKYTPEQTIMMLSSARIPGLTWPQL